MYATARSVRLDTATMLRPPRRVLPSEGARALEIANPSGSFGPWSASVAPYMVEPLDETSSRLFEAVVFVGPARSGKTVALVDGRLALRPCFVGARAGMAQARELVADVLRLGAALVQEMTAAAAVPTLAHPCQQPLPSPSA